MGLHLFYAGLSTECFRDPSVCLACPSIFLNQVGVFNLSACTCLHKLLVSVSAFTMDTCRVLFHKDRTKIAMSWRNQKEAKQAHVVHLHRLQSLLPVLLYWHLLCKELNLLEDLIICTNGELRRKLSRHWKAFKQTSTVSCKGLKVKHCSCFLKAVFRETAQLFKWMLKL